MKILITGPECSGKSTLASALSHSLSIPWFPEHARRYLELHGPKYQQKDILTIAQQHSSLYNTFPEDQPMIMDTYLLNLKIWSEYKYQKSESWIDDQLFQMTPFDFVFLLKPDLPWKQDGLRENENDRAAIFNVFCKELEQLNWSFSIIEGTHPTRLEQALAYLIV